MGLKTKAVKKLDTNHKTKIKGFGNVNLNHAIRSAHSPYKLGFTYHLPLLLYAIIIYRTNSHKLIQVVILLTCIQETSSLNLS